MGKDGGSDLKELERQWDASQDAAEAALAEWNDDEGQSDSSDLIETVLETQRRQLDRYKAVRDYKRKYRV